MIEIKKGNGIWERDASELDDLAYFLYVEDTRKSHFGNSDLGVTHQRYFPEKDCYDEYYRKAKNIIRLEKIHKIMKRFNVIPILIKKVLNSKN